MHHTHLCPLANPAPAAMDGVTAAGSVLRLLPSALPLLPPVGERLYVGDSCRVLPKGLSGRKPLLVAGGESRFSACMAS